MQKNVKKDRQKGFTLIEIIVVLVLVGIMAALAGLGLTTGVRGYLIAAENAEMTQKAQLAMNRLSREIRQCATCDASATNLPFESGTFSYDIIVEGTEDDPAGYITRTLSLDSGTLNLDANALVDQVSSFTLTRDPNDEMITIMLKLAHPFGGTQKFETRILPRNI